MKKILKSFLLILLASSILVTTVWATPTEDELQSDKDAAQQKLEKLQEDMNYLIYKINETEQELISLGQQIIQAEEELAEAEVLRDEQYETMKTRIVVMYENDSDSILSMLLESGSIVEMLKRAENIQAVHDYDRKELESYIENIEKIETLKTSLEEDMASVMTKQSQYEEDKKELNSAIAQLEGEIDDLDQKIQEAAAEAARKAAEEAARKAAEEAAKKEAEEAAKREEQAKQEAEKEDQKENVSAGLSDGSGIVSAAYAYEGVPYVWGGESSSGVDCSGLVKLAHKAVGIDLYHYSGSIGSGGKAVSASEAQPGDVVCYVGHVGIYLGNGMMIHAPNVGDVVRVEAVYGSPWYRRYW